MPEPERSKVVVVEIDAQGKPTDKSGAAIPKRKASEWITPEQVVEGIRAAAKARKGGPQVG